MIEENKKMYLQLMEKKKYLNVALPKGRLGEKVYSYFEREGMEAEGIREESRKLVFENAEGTLRFFWVKPSDVAIYVERGAADIGVAGKDILLEYEPDVYELLALDIGKCRMAVAAKESFRDDLSRTLRVATKFTNIAKQHYLSKGRDIDIIHLNGSIEIAPILGLSDVIVDIVETGATLKENNLEVKEIIDEEPVLEITNELEVENLEEFESLEVEEVDEILEVTNDTLDADIEPETTEVVAEQDSCYSFFKFDPATKEVDADEILTSLKDLDQKYPEKQILEIVELKYNKKLSIAEVAEKTGLTINEIISTLNEVVDVIKD